MRLDKLITACGAASRKEAATAVRRGKVTVNGVPETRPDRQLDPEHDRVAFLGTPLLWRRFLYVMLNKPEGYVSATEDTRLPYVLTLLPPEYQRRGLFPVGRLDRDTTGLLIMTDDGQSAHRLLTPRRHVEKVYRFTCRDPLTEENVLRFSAGMTVGGELCKPALLRPDEGGTSGTVVLTEGKYHEVKRMFSAVGNLILTLERISFAGIPLDPTLPRGGYRDLTPEEEGQLLSQI